MKRPWMLGLLALLALAACTSQAPRIKTSGSLRILSVQPDVEAGCPVRAGDWMALKGNAFGTPEDWGDNGPNALLFPPEPGLAPQRVELTKSSDPATLLFVVPAGAQSGTLRLHVEGIGDAEIPIEVQSGVGPSLAIPGCELPPPPEPAE